MNNSEQRAFPQQWNVANPESFGLTKREYFAAMAMAAIISRQDGSGMGSETVAFKALDYADHILAELEKKVE